MRAALSGLSGRRVSIAVLSDVATEVDIVVVKHSESDVNGVKTSIL